jgi:cardiolipin synthase
MVAMTDIGWVQPPVIGGKNAISRAPDIAASGLTWAWSMAARITFGFTGWDYFRAGIHHLIKEDEG